MKTQIEEYVSLRNEIISIEEQQRNVWIYMYVIFCSLFILGLEWSHYLFLVTYIVLIPFQCVINNSLWSIRKISTYIRVFFENDGNKLYWESFHLYYPYMNYHKEKSKCINDIVMISGATHLGLLATAFFCGYTLKNAYRSSHFMLDNLDIVLMLLSVVLFFIILMINKDYNKKVNDGIDYIMEEYKNSILRN